MEPLKWFATSHGPVEGRVSYLSILSLSIIVPIDTSHSCQHITPPKFFSLKELQLEERIDGGAIPPTSCTIAYFTEYTPNKCTQAIFENMADATVQSLRETLCSESTPLTVRFRALFSLKHVATTGERATAAAAIEAIAAGFASPSALLKHELAYCLGQTKNEAAIQPLRDVLSNVAEDAMCRHEAAEALGALGNTESLGLLKYFRDREGEEKVVTETCEIAIDRIEWENSQQRRQEKLQQRLVGFSAPFSLSLFLSLFFFSFSLLSTV